MFDEMEVGIHLPLGTLTPPLDMSAKDTMQHISDQKLQHHHDEESQIYNQRITLPLQR